MNINVHIERLILDGLTLPPGQRPILQAAVAAELTRLLTESGLSPAIQSGGAVSSLPAGNFQLTADNQPNQLGTQVAQAVYGGIGPTAEG
jgi:hypothetical protein